MSNDQQVSREQRLRQAYEAVKQMQLGEREIEVKLALKALLVMRGAVSPTLFTGGRGVNIYSTIAKYVRASNAETLSGLVDDVLRNISPEFIAHPALGEPVKDIYAGEEAPKAKELLQKETIPLVILMKKVYQQYVGLDEPTSEAEEVTNV
ncbi:MAG: hypothetical protein ACUVV0_13825 [Anaerolineae bacterium]